MEDFNKITAIIGPTASGKTPIAVALAKKINGEIVGLDSRQIYKGMPIGTAQPSLEEQGGIPHHLFGIKLPNESVAAGSYAGLVIDKINEIQSRSKQPIICGGAGLYYRALVKGIFSGSKTNQVVREKLEKEYDDKGPDKMLARLKAADLEYVKLVHPNNKKRLVRALEIIETTGKSPSANFKTQKDFIPPKLPLFTVYLNWDRAVLVQRIAKRTKQMLDKGWISEVKSLMKSYPDENLHPLDSIGYKQIVAYLKGHLTFDTLEESIVTKTRQFAKRQAQWFSKEKIDLTIQMESNRTTDEIISEIINR